MTAFDKIHSAIYSAAKWHHNADEWGTVQGRRSVTRSRGLVDDNWASTWDELDEDIKNALKEVTE